MQKIEIVDAEIITTNGIREAGENYFIDNQGKVYTWGDNLGNGINESSNEPICISDISESALNGKNIVKIQGTSTMIALDSEGKVYTWGKNDNGQLGNGTEEYYSNEPICISDIEGNVLKGKNIVEAQNDSNTVIVLDNEGKVYAWGIWFGNETEEYYINEPICISDIDENVLKGKNIIEAQIINSTIILLDSKGKIYTWGRNDYGRLGNGSNVEYSNEPICISDIEGNILDEKNIVKVQSNGYTVIALDSEGKVYTWGWNVFGQLGNGTNVEYSNEPICISDIEENVLKGKNIVEVQSGFTMIALDNEGKVYTWGCNNAQLGNGTNEDSNEPICISDIEENVLKGKNIVEIQNDNYTMIAIDNERKIYEWGYVKEINEESNEPICITDSKESKLYNKKIKFVNTLYLSNYKFSSYIMENGELYNWYVYVAPSPT